MTLRAIARSRARTRALGTVALKRRPQAAKSRAKSHEELELWDDFGIGDDDFVAIDCRPAWRY
jgi:hypothetical protein